MTLRSPALLTAFVGVTLTMGACSSGGGAGGPAGTSVQASPAAFTVSYRNKVRLPASGAALQADTFASQVRARDPIGAIRCSPDESPAYRDIASFLGGISWTHPVGIMHDNAYPPLYDSKELPKASPEESAEASKDDSAAPTIERPDLVGVKNGVGVFLSQVHGLVAIDARGAQPVVGCSMKLPGVPRNFLFHGDEIVVVVNGRDNKSSALLRYAVNGGAFRFVDAVRLEDQTITDARLFDSTIVAYTSWTANNRHAGTKMIVVQWDDALALDWQDSLLDDPMKQDPMEGQDPTKKYQPGELVDETKSYAGFVAASDRYIVVPRGVRRTTFSHYETYNYQACTSYNPKYEQVQSCNVKYEKRANPDYRAPDPATGNYSCNGKKLADCIQVAAPVVSQYIYVPVGQTCAPVWIGRCEKYEARSDVYPRFDVAEATELTIYRFENGSFTKLDSTLSKLIEKTDAIAFETKPLALDGAITSRNQIQFQNGHLYVFGDNALQTMAVLGGSISYLQNLPIPSKTDGNAAIAFSNNRAMISRATSYPELVSSVTTLDLSVPSAPSILNSFSMPGQSTQLLLATGGMLGAGQVHLGSDMNMRSLQKVTLFSNDNGQELDNLLLGTEYDAFASSYFFGADDQRIRLSSDGTRVFLPYSGRHHTDQYEPTSHRLAIAKIDNGRLVSERSFDVNDNIVRTAPTDDTHSLVFADSASYAIDRTSGDWKLMTLQEVFVPFATYRLGDDDLYAQVARMGTKCRITTHAGDATIFGAVLGQADVACNEYDFPTAIGRNIYFLNTAQGVRISDDGHTFTPFGLDEVTKLQASLPKGHCWIEGKESGQGNAIQFIDSVPKKILCEAPPAGEE